MLNIAVLVSGGGTNLQALLDAEKRGEIKNGKIAVVIASKPGIYALQRAAHAGVEGVVVCKKDYGDQASFEQALCETLEKRNIGLIVLAGYLTVLSAAFVRRYDHQILNVHPSLIPSFCGDGFYGLRVHEAALKKGVKVTGATVHFVNEVTDGGEIVLQKAVEVLDSDTPETLQKRVMEQAEWQLLPKAVSLFCEGRLTV